MVKRNPDSEIVKNEEIRRGFVEELADVLMFFNDILLCYGISTDEFEDIYRAKHERNMKRWKKPVDSAGNIEAAGESKSENIIGS